MYIKTFSGAASITVGTDASLPNNFEDNVQKHFRIIPKVTKSRSAAELGSVCPEEHPPGSELGLILLHITE